MKKTQKRDFASVFAGEQALPMGAYAHWVIEEQYRRVVKQEHQVLADKEPEHLHQMRVGTRRLRTALQVFDVAIALPKAARVKRLSQLARVLGKLRDLDVQIETLKQEYGPRLSQADQNVLAEAIAVLKKQRRKAFAGVQDVLSSSRYKSLKAAYEEWLTQPQFKPMAQVPLLTVVPELLTPLISHLLLHPAWLISTQSMTEDETLLLHELRKAFKHVRYQAEFFVDFYSSDFQDWVQELKDVQDTLGRFQDSYVLLELLTDEVPELASLCDFQTAVRDVQADALSTWNNVQERYLDPTFRRHLYKLILVPKMPDVPSKAQN